MTVGEVIRALSFHDRDQLVYVMDNDKTLQIAKGIVVLEHVGGVPGVLIPADIAILPLSSFLPSMPSGPGGELEPVV